MTEPVRFHVEPPGPRNRWTALFRPVLLVPHAILVGGPFMGFGSGAFKTGALGLLAFTCAVFDWFAILFTGRPLAGLQPLKRLYLYWRARVLAYACFLRDEYPPFGDGQYPASLELPDEPGTRDIKTVALRLFMVLPHLLWLCALLIAEAFVWIASWIVIVFTGKLGDWLWQFSHHVLAYALRIEAYALLIHDRFPRFAVFSEVEEPAGQII
jgi:hypothetical protein